MLNLFKMEFLKHLPWMIISAVLHLLILYFLFSQGSLFTSGQAAATWILGLIVFGSGFGIVQMWQHRRSNEWIYLLHRPMRPATIHLALVLAGMALLVLATLLPAALLLAFVDQGGMNGIEARHYQMLVFAAGVVLTCHALGQFAVLGHNRLAWFGFALAFIFFYRPFENSEKIFTALLIMAWAISAAHVSFKPDLARLPVTPFRLALTELPVHMGCYVMLLPLSMLMYPSSSGLAFWNYTGPDAVRQISQLDGKDKMALALQQSTHADAEFLQQQIRLGSVVTITNNRSGRLPQRYQLPVVDDKDTLFDAERNVRWIFSHRELLYRGVNINTGVPAGWLGPTGFHSGADLPEVRFADIPIAATNDYLVDSHHLYRIDWKNATINLCYTREGPGRFRDALAITENITTLFADDTLYIFSTADVVDSGKTLVPRAVLDIHAPWPSRDLQPFHVMELISGYLVAGFAGLPALANAPEFITHGRASLQLYRAGHGATNELIAEVPLKSDLTEYARYSLLVSAPGIRVLTDIFWGYKFGKAPERTFPVLYADLPGWVIAAITFVSLSCAAITAWLLRTSALPRRIRFTWILLSGFSGIPGLVAFVIGSYWRGADQLRLTRQRDAGAAALAAGTP